MQFWKSRREKVATCEPAAFTSRFVIFNAAGSTQRGRVVEAGLFPELLPVLGKVRVNGKGCSKFRVGDRVACLSKYEGQAELINLPETISGTRSGRS